MVGAGAGVEGALAGGAGGQAGVTSSLSRMKFMSPEQGIAAAEEGFKELVPGPERGGWST